MDKNDFLKKMNLLAKGRKNSVSLEFENTIIKINTRLDNSQSIIQALTILEIPFSIFTSAVHEKKQSSNSFIEYEIESQEKNLPKAIIFFGSKISLKILQILAFILKEIYFENLQFYLHYGVNKKGREKRIFCGCLIEEQFNDRYFCTANTSRAIFANELLEMDISKMNWKKFKSLFPNEHYLNEDMEVIKEDEPIMYDDQYDLDEAIEQDNNRKYKGTYAQDVEGLSDDFIDNALGGDPDSYWNID